MAAVQEIKQKIDDLFTYRKIPLLLRLGSLSRQVLSDLEKLQADIYLLDKYIENNWKIDQSQEDLLWEKCVVNMHNMGFNSQEIKELLGELNRYLDREKDMRNGRPLHLIDIRSFYFYKSCDVHLARKIIYVKAPQLTEIILYRDWESFDYVTEIMDDLSDCYEDIQSLNGNRFLFSLFHKGLDNTLQEYCSFLDNIQCDYYNNPSQYAPLTDWFREEAAQVQAFLENHRYFEEFLEKHPVPRLYHPSSSN